MSCVARQRQDSDTCYVRGPKCGGAKVSPLFFPHKVRITALRFLLLYLFSNLSLLVFVHRNAESVVNGGLVGR